MGTGLGVGVGVGAACRADTEDTGDMPLRPSVVATVPVANPRVAGSTWARVKPVKAVPDAETRDDTLLIQTNDDSVALSQPLAQAPPPRGGRRGGLRDLKGGTIEKESFLDEEWDDSEDEDDFDEYSDDHEDIDTDKDVEKAKDTVELQGLEGGGRKKHVSQPQADETIESMPDSGLDRKDDKAVEKEDQHEYLISEVKAIARDGKNVAWFWVRWAHFSAADDWWITAPLAGLGARNSTEKSFKHYILTRWPADNPVCIPGVFEPASPPPGTRKGAPYGFVVRKEDRVALGKARDAVNALQPPRGFSKRSEALICKSN